MYLDNNIEQIRELCKKYKVKYLFAFGSVLTDKFSEKSDIDFIVDIDLIEDKVIKNKYLRESIDESKLLIYGS